MALNAREASAEIARLALFPASDDASLVKAAIVAADGGSSAP